jgi:acyl dehydratase
MSDGTSSAETVVGTVGATTTITRELTEADLALFALVMGEANLDAEARLESGAQPSVPTALLTALLTECAALHSARPAWARFLSAQMRYQEPAYPEETVRVTATVLAIDATTGALRLRACCETSDGRQLAEAEYLLLRD